MQPVFYIAITRSRSIIGRSYGTTTQIAKIQKCSNLICNMQALAQTCIQNSSDNFIVTPIEITDGCIEAICFKFSVSQVVDIVACSEFQYRYRTNVPVRPEKAAVSRFESNGRIADLQRSSQGKVEFLVIGRCNGIPLCYSFQLTVTMISFLLPIN